MYTYILSLFKKIEQNVIRCSQANTIYQNLLKGNQKERAHERKEKKEKENDYLLC